MISHDELRGCHVALITPMRCDGALRPIDYDRLFELIDDCIEAEVAGLLFAGTTGQSATLTHIEQIVLCTRGIAHARQRAREAGRRIVCIASAGSNSTAEALSLSRNIVDSAGPDALLHVTGYYNNPPQDGLLAHYRAIADDMLPKDTGVIMYNIPGRTGSRIETDTVLRLSEHPAIVGVKDATGDLESVQAIIDGTDPKDFTVLSGEDHLVHEIVSMGGGGVISASANLWPAEFQRLAELALSGERDLSRRLQQALQPCIDAVFSVKNPIPLHHMLRTDLRLPLIGVSELNDADRQRVLGAIERARAIGSFPGVRETAATTGRSTRRTNHD